MVSSWVVDRTRNLKSEVRGFQFRGVEFRGVQFPGCAVGEKVVDDLRTSQLS